MLHQLSDQIISIFRGLQQHLVLFFSSPGRFVGIYIGLLMLAGLIYQLAFPIHKLDTDMWYHLNGGRYFWENLTVPDFSFFSFVEPPIQWTNYYWGFQAIIHPVYELGGYGGLLIARALLLLLITLMLYRFLFFGVEHQRVKVGLIILFVAYFIFLEGRGTQLRPHLFSYLFILTFLHILEHRQKLAFLLPLLGVIWANVHGIEYPVPALIGGAYLVEVLNFRARDRLNPKACSKTCVVSILLCSLALFLTPHGSALLFTPFDVSPFTGHYVREMVPLKIAQLYSFEFSGFVFDAGIIRPLLFLFTCFVLIRSALDRTLRPAHLIMFVGGLVLLMQGRRFFWEWALLCLPLIRAFLARSTEPWCRLPLFSARNLLIGLVLIVPFETLWHLSGWYRGYPFASEGLPMAITRFLETQNTGGRVLAPVSTAGYVQWRLFPRYLIYSDLQNSLFSEWEFFTSISAYRSETSLQAFVEQYQPDYIAVQTGDKGFPDLVSAVPQYVPVVFDDVHVLYVDSNQHPALAEQFRLRAVNPFNLLEGPGSPRDKISEIQRNAALHPTGRRVNHALAILSLEAGQSEEALFHAEQYAEYYPSNPVGEYMVANMLADADRCNDALPHYKKALKISDAGFALTIHRAVGKCYYLLRQFNAAYRHLSKGLNPFLRKEDPEFVYQLAFSAYIVGNKHEAERMLQMLLREASPLADAEMLMQAKSLLQTIGSPESTANRGLLSYLSNLMRVLQ